MTTEHEIRCRRCGLSRLLEQPAGAPCMSCGAGTLDTLGTDTSERPWACFRWCSFKAGDLEVRMTREEFDDAVHAGESCSCGYCLDCRAESYWREAGYRNEPGEYPLDPEFDLD